MILGCAYTHTIWSACHVSKSSHHEGVWPSTLVRHKYVLRYTLSRTSMPLLARGSQCCLSMLECPSCAQNSSLQLHLTGVALSVPARARLVTMSASFLGGGVAWLGSMKHTSFGPDANFTFLSWSNNEHL